MKSSLYDNFLSMIRMIYSSPENYKYSRAAASGWIETLNNTLSPYVINNDYIDGMDLKLLKNGVVSRVHKPQGNYNKCFLFALLLSRGTTIVFNHLEKKCPFISIIYNELYDKDAVLSHFNLYWSPANSCGAGEHVDKHDVIVIQLSGKKRWRVEGENIILHTGDVLLVRKNVLHDPITEADEDSMHLTIGMVSDSVQKVEFNNPPLLREKCSGLSYSFIKNMNLISRREISNFELPGNVVLNNHADEVIFFHEKSSLTLKSTVFNYFFTRTSLNNILNVNVDIDWNHLSNIILSFYEKDIPVKLA